MIRPLFYLTLFFALVQNAQATEWSVDKAKSSIGFSGTHAGSTFDGVFTDWAATIRFDLADLASAQAVVVIKTNSAETGNALYDSTLPGEDWFNNQAFGEAIFKAQSFTSVADGTYRADGTLTIRDKTLPISLNFTLKIEGTTASMTATHSLERLSYGLGTTSDPTADWVSQEIKLTLSVTAQHQ